MPRHATPRHATRHTPHHATSCRPPPAHSGVFGDDLATLARQSPTALLRLASGQKEPFEPKRCKICELARSTLETAAHTVQHTVPYTLPGGDGGAGASAAAPAPAAADVQPPPASTAEACLAPYDEARDAAHVTTGPEGVRWATELPPVLLVNASFDLGLEADAAVFARLLKARTGVAPAHHTVRKTNHTTIAWDEECFRRCREFVARTSANAAV
jgi:hypothetical protein